MVPPPPVAKASVPKKLATNNGDVVKKSAKRALPGTAKKTGKRRKAKKDEKSTTTTTTPTANIPVNVYDAVLGEAEDLMAAAMEAQALGRLKMASAYQLLLHARLVGLGKRFDRARTVDASPDTAATTKTTSPSSVATSSSPLSNAALQQTSSASTPEKGNDEEAPASSVQELAKFIPSNIELDSAMMEHLARAAMELHHQRTGRRIQSDSIASPPSVPPKSSSNDESSPNHESKPTTTTTGVAWTEEEVSKCNKAISKGTTDPSEIAKAVGTRTAAQVKAYLRNTQERQKGEQAVEEEWQQQDDENKEEVVSPRKRGGRGRKPPTQAMNTVPNAKLDARSLLSGKPF